MDNVFRKMNTITYNKKRFVIFSDQKKRKTFLILNKDGKYEYPTIAEFLYLHNIYNNHRYDIKDAGKKYKFDEKVWISGSLVALAIVLGMGINDIIIGLKNQSEEFPEPIPTEYAEEEVQATSVKVESLSELDDILGYKSISVGAVNAAIDQNPNYTPEQKRVTHIFLNRILAIYPDIDLRIFYENVSIDNVNYLSLEELHAKYHKLGSIANFITKDKLINITPNTTDSEFAHEKGHELNCLYKDKDGVEYWYYCEEGDALDEAMNSEVTNLSFENKSYIKIRAFLKYFQTCVNFDIKDYYEKGIPDLIGKLKAKYPDIDIDSIIDDIDTLNITHISKGDPIYTDDNEALLDEIFSMCLANINLNSKSVYEPFIDFSHIFEYAKKPELLYEYLDRYNTYLSSIGYKNTVSKKEISDIRSLVSEINRYIVYKDKTASPVVDYKYPNGVLINQEGKKEDFLPDQIDWRTMSNVPKDKLTTITLYTIADYSNNGWNINWYSVFDKTIGFVSEKETPLYYQGKLIGNEILTNMGLSIARNSKHEPVFVLSNGDDCLFSTESDYQDKTHSIPFFTYVRDTLEKSNDIDRVNLEEYLNGYYLQYYLAKTGYWFSNVYVENNMVLVDPFYSVKIYTDDYYRKINLRDKVFFESSVKGNYMIDGTNLVFENKEISEYNPTYRDILKHAGFFKEDQLEYSISQEEFVELVYQYYFDMYAITLNSNTR